jgi:hypothetical protein|tara:strand:- start:2847 stop:3416 length:570 start_codon:yes stop_codon:yes gene_type:complete
MPAAKTKNPLSGYISLIGGLIPIVGILLGLVIYIVNLNSTISDNAKTLEQITQQLNNPAVKDFLEPNQYGETMVSNRLNGFEYELFEQIFPRIEALESQLLLLEIAVEGLGETQAGINFYLYGMSAVEGGVQQSIQSIKTTLSLLEQSVEAVHADHLYFVDVLEEIEDEFDLRLSKPPDVYGGGYGNYR